MQKTLPKYKMLAAVNMTDISTFIFVNSDKFINSAFTDLNDELELILLKYPNEIKTIVEGRISKVIVANLQYDGWIKKFVETHNISQDFYILFTD